MRRYQNLDLRRRGRMLLGLAVVLGTLTGWIANARTRELENQLGGRTLVLIAAQDIAPHTVIQREMLSLREIPLRYRMSGMIPLSQQESVVGWVTLVGVKAGDLVTENMLARHPQGDPDRRTYTLAASPKIVFGDLAQGDRVDVLAVYRADNQDRSEIAVRDIPVLSAAQVGRQAQVTLLVTAEQAERLAWFENFGQQVRLLRRG